MIRRECSSPARSCSTASIHRRLYRIRQSCQTAKALAGSIHFLQFPNSKSFHWDRMPLHSVPVLCRIATPSRYSRTMHWGRLRYLFIPHYSVEVLPLFTPLKPTYYRDNNPCLTSIISIPEFMPQVRRTATCEKKAILILLPRNPSLMLSTLSILNPIYTEWYQWHSTVLTRGRVPTYRSKILD